MALKQISLKKILVVDDVKLNHSIVKKILAPYANIQIDFLQDSRNVIDRLEKSGNFDLVILDWEMPHLNGPEVCKLIRRHEKFASLPVMFCTANPSSTTISEAFEVGAQDYINKPICPPELLARLQNLFHTRELNEQLKNQIEAKKEMTRILSHDLNNYLSILSGTVEMLQRKNKTADEFAVKSLDRLSKTCVRMADLVKNVRHIQALEDKKQTLEIARTKIIEVLREALGNFEDKMQAKEISVEFSQNANESYSDKYVWAEKVSLLNSVFGNVLSNAIKFSHRGDCLEIDINENEQSIEVVLRDHGIGMSSELIGNVFSHGADTSRLGTESEPGTGFGMPIVKSLMEKYGGKVRLESVEEAVSIDACGTKVFLEFKKCA
jgi:signal transduction histidine kinase